MGARVKNYFDYFLKGSPHRRQMKVWEPNLKYTCLLLHLGHWGLGIGFSTPFRLSMSGLLFNTFHEHVEDEARPHGRTHPPRD